MVWILQIGLPQAELESRMHFHWVCIDSSSSCSHSHTIAITVISEQVRRRLYLVIVICIVVHNRIYRRRIIIACSSMSPLGLVMTTGIVAIVSACKSHSLPRRKSIF